MKALLTLAIIIGGFWLLIRFALADRSLEGRVVRAWHRNRFLSRLAMLAVLALVALALIRWTAIR
ncbi:hypothetical protein [Nonomuraea typhae]|uniref:hypothetical protein n=1 Tax=Nonomuraea typhae TaxID=2603600 RepID=UPI0012F72ACE|nr:hypothetical protein [Nonomuraea typhae]